MHNILTDTCAVCQTNCWRKQRPVSAFLCLAWPSWTLLKQRERFCESLCIQVSLSRRLSPWILPFSFPLLYCLLLCNFPAFLLLSHGKKTKLLHKCKHNKRLWLMASSSCRGSEGDAWIHQSFGQRKLFLPMQWEKCFFRLYLSAVSSPLGTEAAESVPNEVSRDAHFWELDTGLKRPEMAFLGPFSCQQHNIGSLWCRMYSNKGG